MTILVTGGAGYIGSHTVWSLIDAGRHVVVLDRLSTGFAWAVAPDATFYKGDIADRALLKQIFTRHSIDTIVHFAGSVVVPESVSDPLEYYDNNTAKSRILIAAAIEARIPHFVFSSTAAVYGTPKTAEPVLESADLNPESPYGSSKLMTEVMLRDAATAHPEFKYTALRYFNVAGSDPHGRVGQSSLGATHLLKVACETALGKRKHISVFGTDYPTRDGSCVRDYIHVSDLASAHLKAIDRLHQGGDSLIANCGYGKGFTVLEVLDRVKHLSGSDFEINFTSRRLGDAASVVANPSKAMTNLSWTPLHDDLDFIVRTALDWERELCYRNKE